MATDLPPDVDEQADALYCLQPDAFVPARDRLVRELRAARRRAEAIAVARLPRPSLPAWAVNQVVRTQGAAARQLWDAGDAVAETQRRVMAGEAGGDDLRRAVDAERAALTPLADAARGLMSTLGRFLTETAVQQVVETLHAAALDPSVRADVGRGRVARPLRVAGMGPAATADAPQPTGAAAAPEPTPQPSVDPAVEAERARRTELRRALTRAQRDVMAARKRMRTAELALERAAAGVAERRAELERAEAAEDAARRDAQRAEP